MITFATVGFDKSNELTLILDVTQTDSTIKSAPYIN